MKADSELFVKYDGSKEDNIGKHVSSFYMKKLGIAVTTTAIRKLVESKAEEV